MKIGIVTVPFFSTERHLQFAKETVRSAFSMHSLLMVAVVNKIREGEEDKKWLESQFNIIEYNDRNNLARAWNRGIEIALENSCDYVIVINLDIVFHPLCIDNLVACAEKHNDAVLWSGVGWKDVASLNHAPLIDEVSPDTNFSCFMVNKRLFAEVGKFDEQYEPAYHEDADLRYRIKLAGLKEYASGTAVFYHFERATVKLAAVAQQMEFIEAMDKFVLDNLEKYKKKWGGIPGQEKFTTPYGK